MRKLNHIILRKSATSAKRNFIMLMIVLIAMMTVMIAMMIVMIKKFDVRKLHGDSAELDDIDDNYYEHNDGSDDDEFDTRKFHGDARALGDDFMVS